MGCLARSIFPLIGYFQSYSQKYFQTAFNYFSATQRMFEEVYGNEAIHRDIAQSLLSLAYTSDMIGQCSIADKYFQTSLIIMTKLCKPALVTPILVLLKTHNTLGLSYGHYYYFIDFFLRLPNYQTLQMETAGLSRLFAIHLIEMKEYDVAEQLMRTSLEMYKAIVRGDADGEEDDEEVGKSVAVFGQIAWKKRDFQLAENKFEEALAILKEGEGQFANLEAAEALESMGLMHKEHNEYQLASTAFYEAKSRYQSHDKNHPKIRYVTRQLEETQNVK